MAAEKALRRSLLGRRTLPSLPIHEPFELRKFDSPSNSYTLFSTDPAESDLIPTPAPPDDPPDSKQSLRGTILTWIRWTFSQTIFQMPFYFRSLGVVLAVGTFALTFALNYFSYIFLYNASAAAESDFYPEVVERILGPVYARAFRATYAFDVLSSYCLVILVGWQFFVPVLKGMGLVQPEWLVSGNLDELDEYHPQVFLIRAAFFVVLFVTCIPFLLRKKIKDLSFLLKWYLDIMMILILLLVLQMPFYASVFQAEGTLDLTLGAAPPSLNWSEAFFNILFVLNLQPIVLNLKSEMKNPTLRRMELLTLVGCGIQVGASLTFGLLGYMSLGNNYTPYYYLDKIPLDVWRLEQLQTVATFAMFGIDAYFSPVFSPICRPLVADLLGIRGAEDHFFVALSLIPFLIFCGFGVFIPGLYRVVYWVVTPIYCFNSYITPALMQWRLNKSTGSSSYLEKGAWWHAAFFCVAAIVGQTVCLYRLLTET